MDNHPAANHGGSVRGHDHVVDVVLCRRDVQFTDALLTGPRDEPDGKAVVTSCHARKSEAAVRFDLGEALVAHHLLGAGANRHQHGEAFSDLPGWEKDASANRDRLDILESEDQVAVLGGDLETEALCLVDVGRARVVREDRRHTRATIVGLLQAILGLGGHYVLASPKPVEPEVTAVVGADAAAVLDPLRRLVAESVAMKGHDLDPGHRFSSGIDDAAAEHGTTVHGEVDDAFGPCVREADGAAEPPAVGESGLVDIEVVFAHNEPAELPSALVVGGRRGRRAVPPLRIGRDNRAPDRTAAQPVKHSTPQDALALVCPSLWPNVPRRRGRRLQQKRERE